MFSAKLLQTTSDTVLAAAAGVESIFLMFNFFLQDICLICRVDNLVCSPIRSTCVANKKHLDCASKGSPCMFHTANHARLIGNVNDVAVNKSTASS